jgi:hypothetical protein
MLAETIGPLRRTLLDTQRMFGDHGSSFIPDTSSGLGRIDATLAVAAANARVSAIVRRAEASARRSSDGSRPGRFRIRGATTDCGAAISIILLANQ